MSNAPVSSGPSSLAYITMWYWNIKQSADRIRGCGPGPENMDHRRYELHAFALLLREFHRAIDYARSIASRDRDGVIEKALNETLAAWDQAVPDAKDLRDVLAHYDRYLKGKGDLQKNGKLAKDGDLFSMVVNDGTSDRLCVARLADGSGWLSLDLEVAMAAASDMCGVAIEVLGQ